MRLTPRSLSASAMAAGASLLLAACAVAAGVTLSSMDEYAAAHPFANPAAARRLNAVLQGKLPRAVADQPDTAGMGWRMSDAKYYRGIPEEARSLPASWSKLPFVRFRNTEVGGTRTVWFRETPHYDQWLLWDPKNNLHGCVSVERTTRKVYLFEVRKSKTGWVRAAADDNCYSCHPSGPRMIRTFADPGVDAKLLQAFNRRLLSYGACDFSGSEVTPHRGRPWKDKSCAGCHNGVTRGRLYAIHLDPIRFKTRAEGTMPPRLPDQTSHSSTTSSSPTRSVIGSPDH